MIREVNIQGEQDVVKIQGGRGQNSLEAQEQDKWAILSRVKNAFTRAEAREKIGSMSRNEPAEKRAVYSSGQHNRW